MTEEERLAIGAGAESLYERLGRSNQPAALQPSSQGKRVLEAWKRSFSPDDQEAFQQRLTWDALDEAVVEAAWAQTTGGPPREALLWTSWLEAMAGESATWARELETVAIPEELRLLQSNPPRPFVELWIPLIRAVCRALGDERFSSLAEPVRYAFMRQWVREMAVNAELAVYAHFSNDRTQDQQEPSSRSRYRQFVHEMLNGGWIRFFKTYPVTARQMARLAESWAETTRELLDRLESDRPLIAATFAGGEDPGEVALLETGLSDRHNGGRRVVALEFRSGLKLVYKPRHVGLERAYNELLRWAAGRGLEPSPTALRIIERPGYGWVEYVEQGQPESEDEVKVYYRKAGAVVCFAHLLRGKDLHMENVVAAAEGPVLVDTEMLCQPLAQTDDGVAGKPERILSGETCLETGILTTVHTTPEGTLHDIGGLKGSGGFVSPAKNRLWLEVGNDSLRPAEETAYAPQVKNRLFFHGELQRPESYAADILAGFTETYRLALECREELLSPGGPISRFAACDTRVIFRASKQYAVLQYVLAQPKYQREGWTRSVVSDALNREFRGRREPPSIWPIVATERSALEGLDIPRFELPTTATVLVTESGARLEGHYLVSGFAAVAERLGMLSEADLSWQLACLEASLLSSVDTRFVPSGSLADETTDPPDQTLQLMDCARWLGNELLELARERRGELHWDHLDARGPRKPDGDLSGFELYDGTLGVGLFFAALAATERDARWHDAARAITRSLSRVLDSSGAEGRFSSEAIGSCEGLGSLVYSLTWIGRLLNEPSSIELAHRITGLFSRELIASDGNLDIMRGAAGAILALITLHVEDRETLPLELAQECGRHLLARAIESENGSVSWAGLDGRRLAGFAHGAAGIAYALTRLYHFTGDGRLRDAALGAYRYERGLFSAQRGNWPILGKSGNTTAMMTAWCHGAPGIGLARALSLDVVRDPEVIDEIDVAMSTSRSRRLHRSDHLCCGNLGRSEAMFTVGMALDRPDLVENARQVALRVTERARESRRFQLPGTEFAHQVHLSGFFRGLSGIGYQLARFAHPSRLPSILGFEPDTADPKSRPTDGGPDVET